MLRTTNAFVINHRFPSPQLYAWRVLLRNVYTNPHEDNDRTNKSVTLERMQEKLEEDKNSLRWRKSVGERSGEWNSKLNVFNNKEQTSDFIILMQQPMDFRPSAIKAWWARRKKRIERGMQSYCMERHNILGNELAAAHFLLYRGGAVKFVNQKNWMRANEDREFDLPSKYHPAYKIEAIKCDGMTLYHEGLENLRCLQELKFLSFHNIPTFDDWCMDRVSGSEYPKLEVLDISGTSCSAKALSCLYRIPTLKLLILSDPKESVEMELACVMLQEAIPELKIVSGSIHL